MKKVNLTKFNHVRCFAQSAQAPEVSYEVTCYDGQTFRSLGVE